MKKLNLRQQSVQLLLIICLSVAALGYFWKLPGLAAFSSSVPDTSQHGIISQETSQPIMGDSAPPVMRDPFAVPKEFQQVAPAPTPAQQPPAGNYSSGSSIVSPTPVTPETSLELVGVVSGDGQTIAIIKKAGNSRSYQIKEYIGTYQLLAIEESSAILWGTQGKIVLTLER